MGGDNVYSVLILDDEIMVLRPLERALKTQGFIVWGTTDPEEAIRVVEGHRPSVACIDLHMSRINGIEVIKKMRKLMPDIRVVVVTGHLAEYQEDVEALQLRVVEKSSRTARELEAVISEELALSKREIEGLKNRTKPKTNLRILFVDDEPEQTDFFCEIAAHLGAETETASSFEEAVEKGKTFKPNVICTDLKMRNMDGDELIRRMNQSGNHSSVKVYVGITGFNEEKDRLFKAGAAEVLIKPVDLDDFLESMKRWEKLAAG